MAGRKTLSGLVQHASNPLVTSDGAHGYVIGDRWFNTSSKEIFQCVDISTGAAVWKSLTTHAGTAILIAGEKVVSDARVKTGSIVHATCQIPGGTPGFLRISARTDGVSFTVTSSESADVSTIGYTINEP